jgi:hypothetical protein
MLIGPYWLRESGLSDDEDFRSRVGKDGRIIFPTLKVDPQLSAKETIL